MPFHKIGQAVQSGIERKTLSLGKPSPSFRRSQAIDPPAAKWRLIEDPMERGSKQPTAVKAHPLGPVFRAPVHYQLKKWLGARWDDGSSHSYLIAHNRTSALG